MVLTFYQYNTVCMTGILTLLLSVFRYIPSFSVYPVYPCITHAGTTGIIGCARLRSQRLRVFELERLIV